MSTHAPTRLPERRLFIDGDWREPVAGGRFTVLNPATGQPVAEVASADADDVDRAVWAARSAFDGGSWSRLSGVDRGRLLHRVADLIEADLDNLATLETLEIGRPYAEARNFDLPMAVETFRHFAGWADKVHGSAIPVPDFMGRARLSYTEHVPLGVVAAITPWNTPGMIAAWKIAPALAVGCTVVVKPPEDAPLTTLRLFELLAEADLPPGAVNVVPGTGPEAGAALVAHPGVDKVSFTGSPEVGAEIARAVGGALKKVTLELGGKSPQIVFADADVPALLPVAATSLFANQGQTCAAGTRVLVHESRVDEVVEGLVAHAQAVRIGDPFDPATTMGSLINARQRDRVVGYMELGSSEGAELLVGGHAVDGPGFFVQPTVFRGTNDLRIAQEEIFGPVGTVIPFRTDEEAVALANDSVYGLTSVVWTQDLNRAHLTARALRSGTVWVNAWGPPDPRLPWGGTKTSGIGRDLGLAGLLGNTEEKLVNLVF
jgi:betaine-aldehyde dehydrogenase